MPVSGLDMNYLDKIASVEKYNPPMLPGLTDPNSIAAPIGPTPRATAIPMMNPTMPSQAQQNTMIMNTQPNNPGKGLPAPSPMQDFIKGSTKAIGSVGKFLETLGTPQAAQLFGQIAQALATPNSWQAKLGAVGEGLATTSIYNAAQAKQRTGKPLTAKDTQGLPMEMANNLTAQQQQQQQTALDTRRTAAYESQVEKIPTEADRRATLEREYQMKAMLESVKKDPRDFKAPTIQDYVSGENEYSGYFVEGKDGKPQWVQTGVTGKKPDNTNETAQKNLFFRFNNELQEEAARLPGYTKPGVLWKDDEGRVTYIFDSNDDRKKYMDNYAKLVQREQTAGNLPSNWMGISVNDTIASDEDEFTKY